MLEQSSAQSQVYMRCASVAGTLWGCTIQLHVVLSRVINDSGHNKQSGYDSICYAGRWNAVAMVVSWFNFVTFNPPISK